MGIFINIFDRFINRSLRFQFLAIIVTLLIIPVLVMLYDVFFASKSDQVMISDHETRLSSVVQTRIVPGITESVNRRLGDTTFDSLSPSDQSAYLHDAFNSVTEPLVSSLPGVRFGLYLPESKQLYVQGFLHQYRQLSPDEVLERERRILTEADSGIVAVIASQRPLSKLTSSLRDETFEYLAPVIVNNKLVAVAWADERLHPIFAQSRSFRTATRYIALLVLILGALGALILIHNLTGNISGIKKGLREMEKDLGRLLPKLPGETGEVAQAINKMAISLAEKERLEFEMQRSEKLASLGRLVTGVAHELRNPIGVVKATVQVMESEYRDTPGIKEYTSVIKDQVDRQNRVIQELLDFGRPSKNMVQPVDINSLLEKVLTFTSPMIRQHKINLDVRFGHDLPTIYIDPSRIKQVFVNMLLNAIQALPDGGSLHLYTYLTDGHVNVEFRDSGEGISPEDMTKIFDPFYTTKVNGTGLGLSICHQIVRSHNGHIHVSSTPGEGTIFRVLLPLKTEKGGTEHDTQDTGN